MKKMVKIVNIIILLVVVMMFVSAPVQALSLKDMQDKVNDFKSKGTEKVTISEESVGQITTEFADLAKILTTIGAGVLVIIITYMGIKYFISSPEEQAKLKGQLIGIVVSAIVIFGAVSIWDLAITIFGNM